MRETICNFMGGNYLLVCKAGKQVYVPSLFEMRAYCKDTQYRICPHYLNTEKHGPFKPRPPRFVKMD
jgi:hypothetical protein